MRTNLRRLNKMVTLVAGQCRRMLLTNRDRQTVALRITGTRNFLLLCGVILSLLPGSMIRAGAAAPEPPPDYRYKVEVLGVGLKQPLTLQIAPDGRIFFNELLGKLRIWKPGGQIVDAGTIPVFPEQENGLLGLALDPQFTRNQWIYLLYSPTNFSGQRLSRFRMNGDQLDLASERELLRFDEQRLECCHHAGSIRFAPDGCLLITAGDNTHPFGDSESYAPLDERPGHEPWNSQRTAGNTASKNGKILRIRPAAEGGYTIPEGNLFPKDGSGGCPEIYIMGCRNPWRMRVDEKTGYVYWGEVGPDANNDGGRGPRGYDEINQARHAGNFGWPFFVGSNFPYARFDYTTKQVGEKFDPARPVNESRLNTGAKVLPPAQPAMIYWPYENSPEFPMLGSGGRTACAGPVFHFQDSFVRTDGFPKYYDNCLLFWDWQRPFIKWARLDADSNLKGIEPFNGVVAVENEHGKIRIAEAAGKFVIRRPVDAEFGRDGCLYLMDYGETWGLNPDSRLIKLSFISGSLPPIAKTSVSPEAGREPLTVTLSSAGSKDIEGSALQYKWSFAEVVKSNGTNPPTTPVKTFFATDANPRLTLTKPGNYIVQLGLRNEHGAESSASVAVVVGNSPPQVRFESPEEGDFFAPGEKIPYRVRVVDAEDGDSKNYGELMDPQTTVSAQWSTGDEKDEFIPPGLALIKQSDCFNCHSVKAKIVGPAFLDVANKYRNQPGAFEASVQRVTKGSSGVWSPAPMLPHELLTGDQLQLMVRWVYELKPEQNGNDFARGLTGDFRAPAKDEIRTAVFEARYADQPRAGAGSLVGTVQLKLRSRRMEAEKADVIKGPTIKESGKAGGGHFLSGIHPEHTIQFNNLKLADTASVTCRVANADTNAVIEVRDANDLKTIFARIEMTAEARSNNWVEVSAPFQGANGRANVVLAFSGTRTNRLLNLDWIQFNKAALPSR